MRGQAQLPADLTPPRPSSWGLAWILPLFVALRWFGLPLPGHALQVLGIIIVVPALYVFYVHRHEHRPVRELRGGREGLVEGLLGAFLGLAVPAAYLTIAASSTAVRIVGLTEWGAFTLTLGALALVVAVPFFEELLFRGLVLRYLELRTGSWAALALSALLFAAYHSLSQSQSGEVFALRLVAGLAFGAAYLLTRRLWMSIALHCAGNLAVGLFFGDHGVNALLRIAVDSDLPWWLARGMELQVALETIVVVVLVVIARRRGRMVGRDGAWAAQLGGDTRHGMTTSTPAEATEGR